MVSDAGRKNGDCCSKRQCHGEYLKSNPRVAAGCGGVGTGMTRQTWQARHKVQVGRGRKKKTTCRDHAFAYLRSSTGVGLILRRCAWLQMTVSYTTLPVQVHGDTHVGTWPSLLALGRWIASLSWRETAAWSTTSSL